FGTSIGGRNEIGRPLERHLQFFQLAEVALERARGLACGRYHYIEQGGMLHGACGLPVKAGAVKGEQTPSSIAISWQPGLQRHAPPAAAWRQKYQGPGRWRPRPSQPCAI